MKRLVTVLIAAAIALGSTLAFADDEESDEETKEQTIDFTEELDVNGERNEADLYRKEVKREADFDRRYEVEKKSFMGSGGDDESSESGDETDSEDDDSDE